MLKDLQMQFKNSIDLFLPADESALIDLESTLDIALPSQLRELLQESNGLNGEYATNLVWNAQQIQRENQEFRSSKDFAELYMSFDSLLFFGDAGNGDLFAYPILGSGQIRNEIFVWNHENDDRTWIAHNLERFLSGWFSGELTV